MEHTYGAHCRLAPVSRPNPTSDVPPVDAQFFYSSSVPIDDPLSTGPGSGGSSRASEPRPPKRLLRAFSRGDNNALERAWLDLASNTDRRDHEALRYGRYAGTTSTEVQLQKRTALIQRLASRHLRKHGHRQLKQETLPAVSPRNSSVIAPLCCSSLQDDVTEGLFTTFCALVRKKTDCLDSQKLAQDVLVAMDNMRQTDLTPRGHVLSSQFLKAEGLVSPSRTYSTAGNSKSNDENTPPQSSFWPITDISRNNHAPSTSQSSSYSSRTHAALGSHSSGRPSTGDGGISRLPFSRVRDDDARSTVAPHTLSQSREHASSEEDLVNQNNDTLLRKEGNLLVPDQVEETLPDGRPGNTVNVVVGISRLHMVSLPQLQMKPIYWSPVNDITVVTRATWFYRDTMLPVPPTVANQLEAGFRELRPWTETWGDEIRCAVNVGVLGEEKVSHQLWPKKQPYAQAQKGNKSSEPIISIDQYCSSHCFRGEAAAEGFVGAPQDIAGFGTEAPSRPFSNYQVIYQDEKTAFMLKPSLTASAYYGRRPVLKIVKGLTVGIPVVRGFDADVWDRLRHGKNYTHHTNAFHDADSGGASGGSSCHACDADKDRGQVTDLVLVAHGIGQKFAERVESFHFTHAINTFRRAVNIELAAPVVQQVLRKGQNGLMILPLNWRMGLSFENGGSAYERNQKEERQDQFSLKDIEPDSIPAIRSMMSDVMFDIPFYMSHHKHKMIEALVTEANRVYRLWCRNNPGFADRGRVHIIAHSLGSAMALDILSRQPTTVPRIDLAKREPENSFFEFNTTNLFLLGSPAGFFLLLERRALKPRRHQQKPGANLSDVASADVGSEMGAFGCLAVDNIYNILAKEDPIAYLLNGAIDATYSSSLKVAYIPSASTSFLRVVGDAVRTIVPGMSPAPDHALLEPERPATVRLPSQLELEVHDFTREEIAEKKAFLLNDNGQIDWYLRSSGGPLEMQYLNMLSAHTSYWTNHDFIRFLCMEVGRKPGRSNTIPAFRAVKKTNFDVAAK